MTLLRRLLLSSVLLALLASCASCGEECASPLVPCGGGCVDPRTDSANCGACGTPCPDGQRCADSACAWSCPASQLACDGTCVDPLTDPSHCGASGSCTGPDAGQPCAPGQACVEGQCAWDCPVSQVNCEGLCIDPARDRDHCGATGDCVAPNAGSACLTGQVCAAGLCDWGCPAGQVDCGGVCVDPLTDRFHCGATASCVGGEAGAACATGEVCASGLCDVSCPATQVDCGGTCVDPLTDRFHCGATGACAGAEAGAVCPSGQRCSAGQCVFSCPTGQILCAEHCVDPLTDGTHCGGCDTPCGITAACVGGRCQPACGDGFTPCLVAGDWACVSLVEDDAHCGTCDTACAGGWTCAASRCQPVCAVPFEVCGSGASTVCADLAADPADCGLCGAACASGLACLGGACDLPCPFGQTRCGAACVDTQADDQNCGACGAVCPAAASCVAGGCASPACAGTLGLPGSPVAPAGHRPTALAAADFDADGRLDLAVADEWTGFRGRLLLLRGNGDGTFAPAMAFPALAHPSALAAGDLNGDGAVDLVVGTRDAAQESVQILLGDGLGGLVEAPALRLATGPAPRALALLDLDGDGDLDLVVGNGPAVTIGNVKIFLNDLAGATGFFGAGPAPAPPSSSLDVAPDVRALGSGDLDGALLDDVVTLSATGGEVLLSTGTGALIAPVSGGIRLLAFDPGGDPVALAVADLNADFYADWVVADAAGNALAIFMNDLSAPGHGIGQSHSAGLEPRAVVAADLLGDGLPDLATADAAGGTVTALQNVTFSSPCPGTCFAAPLSLPAGVGPAALVAAQPSATAPVRLFVAAAGEQAIVSLALDAAAAPVRFAGGATTEGIALGHLDADGWLDAVTADLANDRLQVWLGDAAGGFAAPYDVEVALGSAPVAVALADVDGDGAVDVVAALEGSGQIVALWGDGAGGLSAPSPLVAMGLPAAIALADLDANGLPDLLAADAANDRIVLLPSLGGRAFGPAAFLPTGASPRAVAAADLDARGCLDVLSADAGAGSLSLFHCDPALPGQFFASVGHQAVGDGPLGIWPEDLDGDGDVDLVVTRADGVLVLTALGFGFFDAGTPVVTLPAPRPAAVADLDLDGRPDLLIPDGAEGGISVALGDGPARFGALRRFDAAAEARAIAVADLDGDGRPEVVVAASTPAGALQGGGVTVLRSRCLP